MQSLLSQFDVSEESIRKLVADTVHGCDDGELYLQQSQNESLLFDDGKLKTANFATDRGFGLRSVIGETSGYAHSGELTKAALARASEAVSTVKTGREGKPAEGPRPTNQRLYDDVNPIDAPDFAAKAKLLTEIDAHLRARDARVRQVTVSMAASWSHIEILRADGQHLTDVRPLVRLNVSVVVGDGDHQETGSAGAGGRKGFGEFLADGKWQETAEEALRQALVNLAAAPAPAGTFDVVLGSGWPGVMLHEAVGHGLEGDFNRKKTSAFAGLLGQQVAAKGVTVVDDGTISERRGSLSIDDEGTPTNRNVLIEDGKLVAYMQDRQNARLMGMDATGNGRRESYAHRPMPRMTNTFMTAGEHTPEEIISSVKNGIYSVSFGGGQVDITSGKFVFGCTEAYLIEDGKVTRPIKGAMLIGNGPDAMKRITMIGNDSALDTGIGMCGKAGQWVPVGVGQPHLRMNAVTVGGTQA
ncbi:metalloprotease TldD [Limoniibacter endophyticus]|uniref:Peptidase C69 n=1 Tax=Limoniibacter endophyticus TaxID=1565040 RepID=A0A8J3GGZ0_9HYPH|nr:metalloprotease TldD [Limoniibacter endophyticus]GHC71483.1 peptidase C69 [Limoniibacter endophyticus]